MPGSSAPAGAPALTYLPSGRALGHCLDEPRLGRPLRIARSCLIRGEILCGLTVTSTVQWIERGASSDTIFTRNRRYIVHHDGAAFEALLEAGRYQSR